MQTGFGATTDSSAMHVWHFFFGGNVAVAVEHAGIAVHLKDVFQLEFALDYELLIGDMYVNVYLW